MATSSAVTAISKKHMNLEGLSTTIAPLMKNTDKFLIDYQKSFRDYN